ncbi:MAG: class I SAM-dependent methyltransferase [Alphaproteobacteria bacterium]|nr:class I SAM-dependent methyltransferase [Alphaproteobacteria bacterium]
MTDWSAYYAKTGGRPPRATLLRALDAFDAEGRTGDRFAVDLGAGGGRDTVEMLRRGWRVLAIDASPDSADALRDLAVTGDLEVLVARFEEADWPVCDLVNASFALPLCPPDSFPALWSRIVARLRPGGRFAGQFYGDRDSWSGRNGMTFVTRTEAGAMLSDLDVEFFDEEEDDSTTPRGEPKHWHVFHIVARKPD